MVKPFGVSIMVVHEILHINYNAHNLVSSSVMLSIVQIWVWESFPNAEQKQLQERSGKEASWGTKKGGFERCKLLNMRSACALVLTACLWIPPPPSPIPSPCRPPWAGKGTSWFAYSAARRKVVGGRTGWMATSCIWWAGVGGGESPTTFRSPYLRPMSISMTNSPIL